MAIKEKEKEISKETVDKIAYLGKEIMTIEKQKLVSRFPYLMPALSALKVLPCTDGRVNTMATNGSILYYNPLYVIEIYKINPICVQTIILHEIFHCMFKHFLRGKSKESQLWNISTDIAINYLIHDLNESIKESTQSDEDILLFPDGGGIELTFDKNKYLVNLNAETIYAYLVKEIKQAFNGKSSIFSTDSSDDCESSDGENEKNSINIDLDKIGVSTKKKDKKIVDKISQKLEEINEKNKLGNHDLWNNSDFDIQDASEDNKCDVDEKWTRINKEIQITRDLSHGNMPGLISKQIDDLNEGKVDWKDTIRRLANSMKESEKEDVNTIDYRHLACTGFYECAYNGDKKVINDFIIAIDTSGSINIPIFKAFLSETINIFKTIRSDTSTVNFYVLQCDTRITDVKHIKKLNNIEELRNLEIKGGGGTNFIPIFNKVDDLIKKKLIKKLKGIIVFTDGFGTFPKVKPQYETLWVFADKYHIEKNLIPFGTYSVINDENI